MIARRGPGARRKSITARPALADPGRRRLLQGLAAGGLTAGLGLWRRALAAEIGGLPPPAPYGELTIADTPVNITGQSRLATLVNGSLPAPTLRWREGDDVTLRVRNLLAETTSIHWHGLILPNAMDGVPGLGFDGIAAGATFEYRLPIRQSGTYWYHSHSGYQEQTGFYGAIVIDPREPAPFAFDRDYVVMLSDWTDEDPRRIHANLRKKSDYYNLQQRTVGDFFDDARRDGFAATLADRAAWGGMRMNPADLADVSGNTYTCLMNGLSPAGNWTALFRPGERVRLRLINAAAMTFFDVRIPGLTMTVVAADGQYVRPVEVEELRIGNAETYDVIVTPDRDAAYTLFAQTADRTGFARGTLAPRAGMEAAVPAPDPRVLLSMADMGHGAGDGAGPQAGHEHHHMGGAAAGAGTVTHAATEFGPGVDMRVDAPSTRLDDPGVGLRNNGRRVLTYADLTSLAPDPDGREPGRTIELHITGNMDRYIWSFNGVKYSAAEPIRLEYGERVRIVLVNDTMMEHPIHLHGMWSDLEDEAGQFKARMHTLTVKPGQKLSFRVRADAPGRWALHCHLMYHMEGGMFREVRVSGGPDA